MNWERAKTFILLFFVAVNVMLFILVNMSKDRYTLSQEQEKAIYNVFNQNKISMYSLIIRQYPPMRPLSVMGFTYDTDELVKLFFPESENLNHQKQSGKEIIVDGENQLVISNGYISYDNPSGWGEPLPPGDAVTRESATALCQVFISRYYPDYQLDSVTDAEDGLLLCYRQKYQEYLVYANFVKLLVTADGITQIDMQYGIIDGFSGLSQKICSPDEVLLTFVQRIKGIRGDSPVVITGMDIVYYQEEYSTQEIVLMAAPYYRIFIDNQEIPFLINAFNNTMP